MQFQSNLFTPSGKIDFSQMPTEYQERFPTFYTPAGSSTNRQMQSRNPTEASLTPTKPFSSRQPITFIPIHSTKRHPTSGSTFATPFPKTNLKDYIKEVLKLDVRNQTVDNIVTTSFNLDTPDPMYVFLLPENTKNRTLVLHRSSFDKAIWPNISPIQRHVMHSNISKLYNLIENIEKIRPQKIKPTVPIIRLVKKRPKGQNVLQRPKSVDADLEEAESIRVVEENVRTERNFLRYMEFINEHPDFPGDESIQDSNRLAESNADLGDVHFQGPITTVSSGWRSTRPQTAGSSSSQVEYGFMAGHSTPSSLEDNGSSVGWEELGLDGWLGGIKAPGKSFTKTR